MRLIDADAFDNVLKDAQTECKKNGGNFRFGVLNNVRENLAKAPTVGGWISVKYRLPEQAGYRCLVSAEYGDGKRTVFTAFMGYGEPGWWTYESVYMEKVRESDNRVHHNYHITHWMPLPKPPEET